MKKYFVFAMLLFAGVTSFAQKLEDINKYLQLARFKEAKDMVNKFLADPKNAAKPDGWYYKGRIYNALSKDSGISSAIATKLKLEAFEALKKCQTLDPKDLNLKSESYVSYFDLYNDFFSLGVKEFGAKNYKSAFDGFKNALAIEEYVYPRNYEYNNFKFVALDTMLTQNLAMSASQKGDNETAISYYKKLTDAGVSGENYLGIYQTIAEHYMKANDQASLMAFLEKARAVYPTENYWTELEVEAVSKTGNKEALYAKYDELMKREPQAYTWPHDYGVELYNAIYVGDAKPANLAAAKDKLTEVLKKAIALDGNKTESAKVLMTNHTYNDAYDYQTATKNIKGATPADVKKRNEAKAAFLKKVDICIPYAEQAVAYFAAQPTLKLVQKENYKIILGYLSQLYGAKADVKKSAEYEKKKAAVDKM